MANDQLLAYIKSVQAQGFTDAMVHDVLAKNGWQSKDIEEAFAFLRLSSMAPTAPVAPMAPVAPSIPPILNPTGPAVHISSSKTSSHESLVEYNSPFSVGLAIVLFSSILILVNKFIDDTGLFTSSANGKLIFDALIILPFLVAAFLLHGAFNDDEKRYLIISQPYFLVSGILLVRLLWDTSAYILNTSATYGVYVVLILIIVVLTGIILFVQKYIRT